MEYVYAALLIHSAGKEITEEGIKNVLKAAGITPDDARAKALISALEGVNIDEILKQATVAPAQVPAATVSAPKEAPAEEKKEKKKEEKKEEESGIEGLSALFG